MNRNKQLLKNTIIILFSKVCTQLITYLLLPMYTTVLSTEEYGTVDLLITYVTLCVPFATVQLEAGVFRYLIDCRGSFMEESKVISNGVAGAIMVAVPFSLIYIMAANVANFSYVWIFMSCVLTTALSSIMLQISRGLGDNLGYALGSLIIGATTVLLNVILVGILRLGIMGMLCSTAIAPFLGALFLAFREKLYRYVSLKTVEKKTLKSLITYSLPLVPNSLSWWVISASSRTVLTIFLGSAANGILAVASKFSAIIANVFAIFNLSWTEMVSVHINDKDRDSYISNITNQCVMLFSCGCLLLISAMPLLFDLLVGENFSDAYDYIPLLIIGSALNIVQTLYGIIYIGQKNTKKVSQTVMVAAAINLCVNLALVKAIGIYSSVLATIAAMLYLTIYRYIDVNRSMRIRLKKDQMIILILIACADCIVYYHNGAGFKIAFFVALLFLSIYLNKNLGIQIVRGIQKKFVRDK